MVIRELYGDAQDLAGPHMRNYKRPINENHMEHDMETGVYAGYMGMCKGLGLSIAFWCSSQCSFGTTLLCAA